MFTFFTSIAVTAFDTGIRALETFICQHRNGIESFFSRCGVEHIDEDEAEGDKEDDPGGDDVGGDEEGDPGHGDEHGGGQVDGEDEGSQRARELHLESVN